jgi:hypothetical protein
MTQSAVSTKHLGTGREQRTDGLWKHLGLIDGGTLRATNNLLGNLTTGAGLELLYDPPSLASYIQSYDRAANAYVDLVISAKTLNLNPNPQAGGSVKLNGPVAVNGRLEANGGIDSLAVALPATGVSTPGDVSVNRGNNTGAYYFVDASHFLFWDGTQFQLSGGKLVLNTPGSIRTADIVAGATQRLVGSYKAQNGWSTTVSGWLETSAQFTATVLDSTSTLRLEACGNVTAGPAGAIVYVGMGIDGGATFDTLQGCQMPGANAVVPFSVLAYYSNLPAGTHRFAIFLFVNTGTGGFWPSPYTSLYVTEQRR